MARKRKNKSARVSVQLVDEQEIGYTMRRVDLRLGSSHALTLRRVAESLGRRGVKLGDGRVVSSPARAVMWILEEIQRREGVSTNGEDDRRDHHGATGQLGL